MKTTGIELVTSSKVATKEDLEVQYNADRQVIIMAGNNQRKIVPAFIELIKSIESTIQNSKSNILFYEMLLTGFGQGFKNPLEAFSSENNKSKTLLKVGDLFEENVSPFGLRVSPSKRPIN